MCYGIHRHVNELDSFHNKLKTTYLDGKVNRRVDYLLDTLIRMERDQFFGYMYKTQMLQTNPKDQSETQRHERGLSIPVSAVKVPGTTQYNYLHTCMLRIKLWCHVHMYS